MGDVAPLSEEPSLIVCPSGPCCGLGDGALLDARAWPPSAQCALGDEPTLACSQELDSVQLLVRVVCVTGD